MTALERYAKLEAEARYVDGASATPRDVVISFGARSLIIIGIDDTPIAHWPLASLRSLSAPGAATLELVPDAESDERLLLADREMQGAIAEVCPRLETPVPRRRRRGRLLILGAGIVLAALIAVLSLEPPTADRVLDFVPPEREQALGEALVPRLADLVSDARPRPAFCVAEEGAAALRAMTARLSDGLALPYALRVSVLDEPTVGAVTLPGGRVLIFRGLLSAARAPEEVAGVLAHQIAHALHRDPLRATVRGAGSGAVAAMIFGDITEASVLSAAADAALGPQGAPSAERVADDAAFAVLARAGLPTLPFASFMARLAASGDAARYVAAHAFSADRAATAAAADTMGADPFRPALHDRDWIALGNICDRTAPIPDIR